MGATNKYTGKNKDLFYCLCELQTLKCPKIAIFKRMVTSCKTKETPTGNTYLKCMIVSCHLEVVVVHPGQEVCRGCCRGRVLTSTEVQGEAAEPGGPAGDQPDLVTSQQERGLLGQVQQLGGRHQQLWGEKML